MSRKKFVFVTGGVVSSALVQPARLTAIAASTQADTRPLKLALRCIG